MHSSVTNKLFLFKRINFNLGINSHTKAVNNVIFAPFSLRDISSSSYQVGNKEREEFRKVLPGLIKTITSNPKVPEIPDLKPWIEKIMTHNVTGGKGLRGQYVVMAYEMLENPNNVTEDSLKLANTLGWFCEMFQSYLVILDDIIDGSSTRRGQPCWYRAPGVGVGCAINDANILYGNLFYALKVYFGHRPDYVKMLDTFNETLLNTSYGEYLDEKTSTKTKDYSQFTIERHRTIVKYKSAYYTYDMPVYLGSILANYNMDESLRKKVQDICLEIGILFQIQDDYIDCYGDERVTGKAGSDIRAGKCSWLAAAALQRCSAAQRVVFSACYASDQPAHIERIQQLYNKLKLPELYREIENKYYRDISDSIKTLRDERLRKLFDRLLNITYQRQK